MLRFSAIPITSLQYSCRRWSFLLYYGWNLIMTSTLIVHHPSENQRIFMGQKSKKVLFQMLFGPTPWWTHEILRHRGFGGAISSTSESHGVHQFLCASLRMCYRFVAGLFHAETSQAYHDAYDQHLKALMIQKDDIYISISYNITFNIPCCSLQ